MIDEIFQVLLWATAILLVVSGIDDLYLDLLYWLLKGRHKSKFPDFSRMHDKPEKPIAIFLGAWNESGVIGRTLSYAIRNIKYNNFRIFVGVYPNDAKTIKAVKEISLKDPRVIACINPQNGPTTKADNLNSLYAGLCEYEKVYGEFEILIVHDAEDFIHPFSMKLYNFLIGYKGYHGVQIPVIPIKSKLGKLYHRTYCDAFAEIHTKDMIVRQGMGTFIPFSGTGMGFHRKAITFLDMYYNKIKNNNQRDDKLLPNEFHDENGGKIELTEAFFNNNEETVNVPLHSNNTNYHDDPFHSLIRSNSNYKRSTQKVIRRYTTLFVTFIVFGIGFLIYKGNFENDNNFIGVAYGKGFFFQNVYAGDKNTSDYNYLPSPFDTSINNNPEKNIDLMFLPAEKNKYDKEYDVVYIALEDGKFGIQESVWSSINASSDRLNLILHNPSFNYLKGYIEKEDKSDKPLYKVIIGGFNNINEAHKYTIKIRKQF